MFKLWLRTPTTTPSLTHCSPPGLWELLLVKVRRYLMFYNFIFFSIIHHCWTSVIRSHQHPCKVSDIHFCSSSVTGSLTWMPLSTQPVQLTIKVSDSLRASSFFTPILRVCSCLNGGTCLHESVNENHLQGKFQVMDFWCWASVF